MVQNLSLRAQASRESINAVMNAMPPLVPLYETSAQQQSLQTPISSQSTVQYDPVLQRLDTTRVRTVEMRPKDAHMKALMTRVAMGEATLSEMAEFQGHVATIKSGGSAYSSNQPSTSSAEPTISPSRRSLNPGFKFPRSPTPPRRREQPYLARCKTATKENASKYTEPFCDFMTGNPTVFHAVSTLKKELIQEGFELLSERDAWDVKPRGKYVVERNGSALIAFTVGADYEPGNGAAILAGHVDAITAKLKPVSQVPNKAGYIQLGVAPYAGGMSSTWWDRDLSVGGRVLVKEDKKIVPKLVKLDWPIAKIPTLAPHFGAPSAGPFNLETQVVPIIGLEGAEDGDDSIEAANLKSIRAASANAFLKTQPPALVTAISDALGLSASDAYDNIVNWELELFDLQPATVSGLRKEFISAGRIDDKLCSWAALQALIESSLDTTTPSYGGLKVVGLFDDEEIGSLLRQGARGNFLPSVLERAVTSLTASSTKSSSTSSVAELMGRTYANSFLVSSDVTHAVNPNFLNVYLENHAPQLNTGLSVSADPNGHMTTDAVSTAILQRCADIVGAKLQVFQIRNDSRSGGTVGPMLSSATGIRAIDAGIPQLSMHSIRATTGALDPGLGVITFRAFLDNFEEVDKAFRF